MGSTRIPVDTLIGARTMEHMDLLDVPRLCILITGNQDGSPIGVPIWFDWDGACIRFFATRNSKKVKLM